MNQELINLRLNGWKPHKKCRYQNQEWELISYPYTGYRGKIIINIKKGDDFQTVKIEKVKLLIDKTTQIIEITKILLGGEVEITEKMITQHLDKAIKIVLGENQLIDGYLRMHAELTIEFLNT